jgi:sparc/osteonectin/cwcv/kazal-like domain-containing proteoglycan (testican)
MRVILVLVVAAAVVCTTDAKRKRKFDGDFEFAEEEESKAAKSGEKKRWIHDPSSDLCRPLNCKKKEICLLEDSFTAVCVSRKELKKNGDIVVPKSTVKTEESKSEDDDDDVFYDTEDDPDDADEDLNDSIVCKPCPVVKPTFLCGSDNRTYSSLCRLDYHNCIHHTSIRVTCKGFCPCKENEAHLRKKQRQSERLNSFMNKYKATLDKSGTVGGSINGVKPAQPSSKSDVYTFTPQDFKYENKHYKYIKYTKYNKDNNNLLYAEDKDRLRGYNEVTDNKLYSNSIGALDPAISPSKQCSAAALQAMGNRLLDWFSVVMADSSKRRRPRNKSKGKIKTVNKNSESLSERRAPHQISPTDIFHDVNSFTKKFRVLISYRLRTLPKSPLNFSLTSTTSTRNLKQTLFLNSKKSQRYYCRFSTFPIFLQERGEMDVPTS